MVTVGRIVNYVLAEGANAGQIRPAMVVNADLPSGTVNLQVFTDTNGETHMLGDRLPCPMWRTNVRYSEIAEEGTWHWPKRE